MPTPLELLAAAEKRQALALETLAEVRQELETLRMAARKYLKKSHEPLCKMRNYSDGPARVCTCGRDALAQVLGEGKENVT